MKSISKYTKALLLGAFALVGFCMVSCEDEPDRYVIAHGKPVVHYIRNLGGEVVYKDSVKNADMTNTQGQFVVECTPQSTLALVGENMRSIVELYFNDCPAILVTSYITDNSLIVVVPESVPKSVTDKIYMVTLDGDTVTYDFHVIIPGPELITMGYEYAKPGSQITLTGRYLIDDPNVPLHVFFPTADGGVTMAKIDEYSDDYTTLKVTIPEDAAEGKIQITNVYGDCTSKFNYLDSGNGKDSWMLFDFDGKTGLSNHGWHARDIVTDEWSISGAYLQLGNGSASMADDTWDDSNFSFEYWPGNWKDVEDYADPGCERLIDIADFSDWENMSLKFELCVPSATPWTACALQIIPSSTSDVTLGSAGTDIFGLPTGGCNNVYVSSDTHPRALYRPWTATEKKSFDTKDEWITVTIPLGSSFTYGYSGVGIDPKLTEESWSGLTMFLASGGVAGTPCTPVLKIDNIRVVKN